MSLAEQHNVPKSMGQRIGLYGGTFDPVHLGHIELLLAAQREAALDKVLVIPAAVPPHKPGAILASFRHRVAMLHRALADYDAIELCLIEEDLPKPSFTIDTVKALEERASSDEDFFFIIGSDAFAALSTWKAYRELLTRVSLLVGQRQGGPVSRDDDLLRGQLGYQVARENRWCHPEKRYKEIRFLNAQFPQWSSSQIREAVGNKAAPQHPGLSPLVQTYITQNGLYEG